METKLDELPCGLGADLHGAPATDTRSCSGTRETFGLNIITTPQTVLFHKHTGTAAAGGFVLLSNFSDAVIGTRDAVLSAPLEICMQLYHLQLP